MWRKFNLLTISDSFTKKWQDFLQASHLQDQPIFYQHFTDELFDSLVQKKLRAAQPDEGTSVKSVSSCKLLNFEEENAVRYIGGYVVKKLKEHPDCSEFKDLLNEMVCTDNTLDDSLSAAWTNAVNRGGLVKITSEVYQVFLANESCVRR